MGRPLLFRVDELLLAMVGDEETLLEVLVVFVPLMGVIISWGAELLALMRTSELETSLVVVLLEMSEVIVGS